MRNVEYDGIVVDKVRPVSDNVSALFRRLLEVPIMAAKDDLIKLEVTVVDKQWLRRALETQRNVIVRTRNKEVVGSEIYELRTREIGQINAVLDKVNV